MVFTLAVPRFDPVRSTESVRGTAETTFDLDMILWILFHRFGALWILLHRFGALWILLHRFGAL